MLYHLRQGYYCSNLAAKVQAFTNNCQTCIRSKPIVKQQQRPPLQKIYDPSNGPEDVLEIDLLGPLPPSNDFTYILTECDVFARYIFAIPLRRHNAQLVGKGLISIFIRQAYVMNTILTDKSTAFTAEVVKRTMEQAGSSIKHATIKDAKQ